MILRLFIMLFCAFILTIMPLPDVLVVVRPSWIFLIVLYVQLYLPKYFNVTLVFILGLILDSLLVTVIGEHAFSLCVVTWFVNSKVRRLSLFPIIQQMIIVGFFVIVYQGIIVLIDSFLGYQPSLLSMVGAALVSALVWPWLCLFGEELLLTPRRLPNVIS